jgi:hypothetical protein
MTPEALVRAMWSRHGTRMPHPDRARSPQAALYALVVAEALSQVLLRGL